MDDVDHRGGVPLSAMVDAADSPFLGLVGDPRTAGTTRVEQAVLADPLEPLSGATGALLLLVGVEATTDVLRRRLVEAKDLGYRAGAVKLRGAEESALAAVADGLAMPLLLVPDAMPWTAVESLVTNTIVTLRPGRPTGAGTSENVFALANAIAASAGAAISIEDVSWQVLAYSTIDGQPIDAVRRDVILGRAVPRRPDYTEQYRRVATSTGTVAFPADSHDKLHRVAIPVAAGGRLLGFLWAAHRHEQPAEPIAQVLTDFAPAVATCLLRATFSSDIDRHRRAEQLVAILDGRAVTRGLPPTAADQLPVALFGFGPLPERPGARDEQLVADIVRLRVDTLSAEARTAWLDDGVLALVPSVTGDLAPQLVALAETALHAAQRAVTTELHCAYTTSITAWEDVADARRRIGLSLRAAVRRGTAGAAVDVDRSGHVVVMQDLIESGPVHGEHLIGPVRRVLEHDARSGTRYAETLVAHLDHAGDVASAAAATFVHANSHRYRMRRIAEQFDLDLDDPELRLVLWLQLRCAGPQPR